MVIAFILVSLHHLYSLHMLFAVFRHVVPVAFAITCMRHAHTAMLFRGLQFSTLICVIQHYRLDVVSL